MRLAPAVLLVAGTSILLPTHPPDGQIAPIADMREARAHHAQILLPDGRVFIAGGFPGSGGRTDPYRTTEFFDPRRGEFRAGPEMSVGRSGATATLLLDGRVLLAGGWTGARGPGTAEILDPRTNTIAPAVAMTTSRAGHTATRLNDGRVLIVGGGDASESALASVELFNPGTGRFTLTGSMAVARESHTATLLNDGKVLIAAGARGHYPNSTVSASLEVYDPATDRFSPAGALQTARYKHAAVRLADGRVLIVGGSDERDWNGQLTSTEICGVALRCQPGPQMHEKRFKIPDAVAALPDGSILIAGGGAAAELLDSAGTSLAAVSGPLNGPRYFASTTALPDGRVLITGGYAEQRGSLPATRAAYLYKPQLP